MSDDENACLLDDLVIYGGIIFLPDLDRKQVRLRHEQFEITEFAIQHLTEQFAHIELSLAPQFQDMRPFLWHEYHNLDPNSKFALDLRYTSYVDISSLNDSDKDEDSPLFRNMETLRQRHVRDAKRRGGKFNFGLNCKLLLEYYNYLMSSQGEVVPSSKLGRVRRLIDGLILERRCVIFQVLNLHGVVIYATAYAWDSKRAYYLFGAGNPMASEPWQGTFAHWSAFLYFAKQLDLNEVDMEGVNSPKRGWFKLGFGGSLKSYYQVYKKDNIR